MSITETEEPIKRPQRPTPPKQDWDLDNPANCVSCDYYRALNGDGLCSSCATVLTGMGWEQYAKELEVYLDYCLARNEKSMKQIGMVGKSPVYIKKK